MASPNVLVRAAVAGKTVRALAAVTTGVVEEARQRHGTYPTATAALGRALTAGLLLGNTLDSKERISLQFSGNGPLRGILVEANAQGEVRGFVTHPRTHLPPKEGKLDVGGALGQGLLCVMRVPSWDSEPYRGIIPLVSGEIGKDVAHYLLHSEQIPSAVGLGVYIESDGRVGAAGGFLIQVLAAAGGEIIEQLAASVERADSISRMVHQGMKPQAILARMIGDLPSTLIEEQEVRFVCGCDRERVLGALVALGREEIRDILRKEGQAEVRCEFCSERYVVGGEELKGLLYGH